MSFLFYTVVPLLLSLSSSQIVEVYPPVTNGSTNDLFIGVIQSLGGSAFDGSGVVPGIRVAIDLINNSTNILNGYTLHYVLGDSQVIIICF